MPSTANSLAPYPHAASAAASASALFIVNDPPRPEKDAAHSSL